MTLATAIYPFAVLFFAGSVWWGGKRLAGTYDSPRLWDISDLLAGVAAGVPTLYIRLQMALPGYEMDAIRQSVVMFLAISIAAVIATTYIEEETDWLPRPDRLAPPAKRIRGQQTIDDGPGPETQSPDGQPSDHQ